MNVRNDAWIGRRRREDVVEILRSAGSAGPRDRLQEGRVCECRSTCRSTAPHSSTSPQGHRTSLLSNIFFASHRDGRSDVASCCCKNHHSRRGHRAAQVMHEMRFRIPGLDHGTVSVGPIECAAGTNDFACSCMEWSSHSIYNASMPCLEVHVYMFLVKRMDEPCCLNHHESRVNAQDPEIQQMALMPSSFGDRRITTQYCSAIVGVAWLNARWREGSRRSKYLTMACGVVAGRQYRCG